MFRDNSFSGYSDYSKPNRALEAAIAIAEVSSFFRAVGETLGIVKVRPLGGKKPEGSNFWGKIKNAQKSMIGAIDRLAGVENNEKGKWKVRAAIIGAIAIPIAIVAIVIGFHAKEANQGQGKKVQEKIAPAPRKATGMQVHKNDALYQMAFGSAQRKTFVLASQQPAAKSRQPAANRIS